MGSEGTPKFDKVFVGYSRGLLSGGTLAAHQLVDRIRGLGGEAFLVPSHSSAERPRRPEYEVFDAPEAPFEDAKGNLFVTGEFTFRRAALVKHARVGIWWLSADKSVPIRVLSDLSSLSPRRIRAAWRYRIRNGEFWAFLKLAYFRRPSTIHFYQSHYARERLRRNLGLHSSQLGDYIWPMYSAESRFPKGDNIAYNPKKGADKFTDQLIATFPDFHWVPTDGSTHSETRKIIQTASLYVDFCDFPGRDRLPREAILDQVPVLLAKRGSSADSTDFPLPDDCLVSLDGEWIEEFQKKFVKIRQNPNRHIALQAAFRDEISKEESAFTRQVEGVFFDCRPSL